MEEPFISATLAQDAFGDMNDQVLESVAGVRVVRAYVQERADQRDSRTLRMTYIVKSGGSESRRLIRTDHQFLHWSQLRHRFSLRRTSCSRIKSHSEISYRSTCTSG